MPDQVPPAASSRCRPGIRISSVASGWQDFVADGRGAISADGRTITPLRWSTPLRDYAQVGPARVATKAEVNWHPDSGAWTYGEFALTSLAYNVVNRGRPVDQEAHRPMIGHRSETR